MNKELLISGLLAAQSLAAQNTFAAEASKKSICSAFKLAKDVQRVSTFEAKLSNDHCFVQMF